MKEHKKNVEEYVKLCVKCVIKKTLKQSKMRKYQSLSISKKSFKKIVINFVMRFLKSQNSIIETLYDMIAIIVDELIKYVKFISYQLTMTAK